jgi:ferritin-like metal-binding protein YciE
MGRRQRVAPGQASDREEGTTMSEDENGKEHLIHHLHDTYALEEQATKQLERAVAIAQDWDLADAYTEHLEQTEEHKRQLKERIESLDRDVSPVEHLTMRSDAIGLRLLADIAPESPAKLAMHFYALGQLEVAAYEMLQRIAKEAGDDETAEVAEKILEEERQAADKVKETFDRSAELMTESS